jgi:hypothetical protein
MRSTVPKVTSAIPAICAESVAGTAASYRDVVGLEDVFSADWYAQLRAPRAQPMEA